MGLAIQFFATSILSIICVNIGILLVWPSSTMSLFRSENTTLARPMTESEISLFGSLPSIGSVIGTPVSGYLIDRIGRKHLTIVMAITQTITWIIRVTSTNIALILFSSAVSGVASCGTVVIAIYVAEYSQQSVRGLLTSTPMGTSSLGLVIGYWMGGTLEYYTVIYICLAIALLGVVMVTFLKESPIQLMRLGLKEQAALAISFYRNEKLDSTDVLNEIDSIIRSLNPEVDDKFRNQQPTKEGNLTRWQLIKKSHSTRRAFAVCFVIALLSIFQGMSAIQTYAGPLFTEAMPNISPTLTTVLLGVVSLVSAVVSGYLTDIAGRRSLLIYGSIAAGVVCTLLGTQLQVTWGPHWTTAVLIYLYVANIAGTGTAFSVVVAELFLPEIRGLATMSITETKHIANFVILYIFNPLVNHFGLPPVFYIFAAICLIIAIFSFFTLPETKGLAVDKIQHLFNKKV